MLRVSLQCKFREEKGNAAIYFVDGIIVMWEVFGV